jgi:hypothetical protein
MDELTTILALILGVLLRVAIPLAVTFAFIKLLKRLDERWKREADLKGVEMVKVGNIGCWDINNCSEELRTGCQAYANPDKPCWQIFRGKDGRLQERCIGCDIFKHAPLPVTT